MLEQRDDKIIDAYRFKNVIQKRKPIIKFH
jgi:hypothetical protein